MERRGWGAPGRVHPDLGNSHRTTALHDACYFGELDTAREMLERGAKVDPEDKTGATPLVAACSMGHVPCISLLLEHGARAHPKAKEACSSGMHCNRKSILRMLQEAGDASIAEDDEALKDHPIEGAGLPWPWADPEEAGQPEGSAEGAAEKAAGRRGEQAGAEAPSEAVKYARNYEEPKLKAKPQEGGKEGSKEGAKAGAKEQSAGAGARGDAAPAVPAAPAPACWAGWEPAPKRGDLALVSQEGARRVSGSLRID